MSLACGISGRGSSMFFLSVAVPVSYVAHHN